MKAILTIALCALTLTGCIANWPSNRTGSRWTKAGDPYFAPYDPGGARQEQQQQSPLPPPPSH